MQLDCPSRITNWPSAFACFEEGDICMNISAFCMIWVIFSCLKYNLKKTTNQPNPLLTFTAYPTYEQGQE